LSPLGIVSALVAEARHLSPGKLWPGVITRLGDGALLVVSGVGARAAAAAARALIEAGAGALLSFGLAGGLDPALPAGTVCLPSEVISGEGAAVPTEKSWREGLCLALASCCLVSGGKLLASPVAIDKVAQKARTFRETGAAAVDMESLAIAQVARQHGKPFMAVRVIVDTARDSLPASLGPLAASGEVRLAPLLAALAAHPQDLPAVVRLAGRYRAASRSLAAVARSGALAQAA
jgi:hypothetical protein